MADDAPEINALTECESSVFGDDSSRVKILAVNLYGVLTDIVICDYSDRLLIIITQFGKIGTLITVAKGSAKNLNSSSDVYNVNTICGLDNQEYHLAARYLAEQISVTKPVVFGLSLKDHQLKILKALATVLLDNKLW